MRHRLVVVAPSTDDVVRSAGGWLCDQVMAGWEVVALTPDGADTRPLRILGVTTADLESALADPDYTRQSEAVAFDAHLCGADPRVRRLVRDLIDEGPQDVRFWGWGCPLEDLEASVDRVTHRLSHASKAFKTQAVLALAGGSEPLEATEMFALAATPQRPARALSPVSA